MATSALQAESLIAAFTNRAARLRLMSNIVLGAIITVIAGGIAIFSFAYSLSKAEYPNNMWAQIKLLTDGLEKIGNDITDLYKNMGTNGEMLIEALKAGGCGSDPKGPPGIGTYFEIHDDDIASDLAKDALLKIGNRTDATDPFGMYISVRKTWNPPNGGSFMGLAGGLSVKKAEIFKCLEVFNTDESSKRIAEESKSANSLINQSDSIWRVLSAAISENDKLLVAKIINNDNIGGQPLYSVIQTNVTRIGSLIMIIFLVTILAPLYRYCLRLAAFYDARADALRIQLEGGIAAATFARLAAAMTPTLDFGSAPSTPIDQLISLIKEIRGATDSKSEAKA